MLYVVWMSCFEMVQVQKIRFILHVEFIFNFNLNNNNQSSLKGYIQIVSE